jgi:hypothetical protein
MLNIAFLLDTFTGHFYYLPSLKLIHLEKQKTTGEKDESNRKRKNSQNLQETRSPGASRGIGCHPLAHGKKWTISQASHNRNRDCRMVIH